MDKQTLLKLVSNFFAGIVFFLSESGLETLKEEQQKIAEASKQVELSPKERALVDEAINYNLEKELQARLEDWENPTFF